MVLDASKRVVVTGLGGLCSVGNSVPAIWDSLLQGKSGIGPITRFDASDLRTRIAGEIKNFDPTSSIPPKEAKRMDPYVQYAVVATEEAVRDAALDFEKVDRDRVGVLIGSGIGGIMTLEEQVLRMKEVGGAKVSPLLIPMMISDMASGVVSMRLGAKGPNYSIVSACATGSHAIGEAFWAIRRGDADVMITGGTEAPLAKIGVAGFCAMKAMSERNDDPTRASRPFDAGRDGFVIAEGAGIMILETLEHAQQRGARILAELVGYGATADAYHLTAPCPDGSGAARAIAMAMRHAQARPEEIGYINAHGTSTPYNDKFETMAIKRVFGAEAGQIPVTSTKSLTGHALGAAGGLESIVCVKVLCDGRIPGTWNFEQADPDCDLNYLFNQTGRLAEGRPIALNMNFGFGGHNAVVAFRKF